MSLQSANAACNQVYAVYSNVVKLLDVAIQTPFGLIKIAQNLIDRINNIKIIDMTKIFNDLQSFINQVAPPDITDPIEKIIAVFNCPLLDAFMPKQQLEDYRAMLQKIQMGAASLNDLMQLNAHKRMLASLQSALTNQINGMTIQIPYDQLNVLTEQLNKLYDAPLTSIGLPNTSIRGLLRYLYVGEQCIKNTCSAIESVASKADEFSKYCDKLLIAKDNITNLEINILQNVDPQIADAISATQKDVAALKKGVTDQADKVVESLKPVDPVVNPPVVDPSLKDSPKIN